jgi:AraC-like DNA-binding protein
MQKGFCFKGVLEGTQSNSVNKLSWNQVSFVWKSKSCMERIEFIVEKNLEPFVNCIMVREEKNSSGECNIPLHADGYPGIMFQQSDEGFYLHPGGKKLSQLFLYGQTIRPVTLKVTGPFRFVVFQLYPFASKYLLGVNPRELNDECFDLLQLRHINIQSFVDSLLSTEDFGQQASIISEIMLKLIPAPTISFDDRIQLAVHRILEKKGILSIQKLFQDLHITERTFERNFLAEVGLTPKQFAKIIQFQYSLQQLTQEKFDTLTEIGIESGFSDQSHFIREFKKYTGQTPSYYLGQQQ